MTLDQLRIFVAVAEDADGRIETTLLEAVLTREGIRTIRPGGGPSALPVDHKRVVGRVFQVSRILG